MNKKFFASVIILLLSLQVSAKMDLSDFELTATQIETFRKFEAKDKYSQDWLLNFAQAMHNHNVRERSRQQEWVPTYTEEELWATIEWARGGAFSAYADMAGYRFNGEAYRADCPNVGLFRFGRASGTRHIPVDVMKEAINQSHYLQVQFSRDRENFSQIFWDEAVKRGFAQYLSPLEQNPTE